jgi:hypothetical protein
MRISLRGVYRHGQIMKVSAFVSPMLYGVLGAPEPGSRDQYCA